jgi:hypothetical protein
MTDDQRPLFTSFDETWRWFAAGGELTAMAEWRRRLTAGRAQLLSTAACASVVNSSHRGIPVGIPRRRFRR